MNIDVHVADYSDSREASDVVALLNAYANDPMGGATELTDFVKQNLIEALIATPNAFSILCYVDGVPAGLTNCFQGFSTFKAKPLINIHDVVVVEDYRGRGLTRKMFEAVERIARERGCCKLTLEVLTGNTIAQKAYEKYGFEVFELDPKKGRAMFWEMEL